MTFLFLILAINDPPQIAHLEMRPGLDGALVVHARLADPDGNQVHLESRGGSRSHAVPSGFTASVVVAHAGVEVRAVDSHGAASPWVRIPSTAPSPMPAMFLGFSTMAAVSLLFWRIA